MPPPVAAATDALAPPELPPIAPADYAAVAAMRVLLAQINQTCVIHEWARMPSPEDPRCEGWFQQVQHGGKATVHAVGGALLSAAPDSTPRAEHRRPWITDYQRSVVLGSSGDADAVPYLLRFLLRPNAEPAAVVTAFQGLATLAGYDPAPAMTAGYDGRLFGDPAARRTLLATWLRWYAANRGATRDAWLAAGVQRATAALTDADPNVCFWGARLLTDQGRARPAVAAALTRLVARTDLSAILRANVESFRTRQGYVPGR